MYRVSLSYSCSIVQGAYSLERAAIWALHSACSLRNQQLAQTASHKGKGPQNCSSMKRATMQASHLALDSGNSAYIAAPFNELLFCRAIGHV